MYKHFHVTPSSNDFGPMYIYKYRVDLKVVDAVEFVWFQL